jgi:hypothetical protein
MRSRILAALMGLMLAAPAGAAITDVEPANDTVAEAPVQVFKTAGSVTTDVGVLELDFAGGDIDFVGIDALSTGDIVTVTTTPLEDPPDLNEPDTIVGLFDSSTTDPTTMILCLGRDTENNELITQGQDMVGYGSICRFEISAPGDYYVGVAGTRPILPAGCNLLPGGAANCTIAYPFDGKTSFPAPDQCEEPGDPGPRFTCGNYQVTIAVRSLPEPGVMLQLVSGGLGLAWLNRRRNRSMAPSSQRSG